MPSKRASRKPGATKAGGRSRKATQSTSAATVGYEAELWKMADTLRGSMDAAEYKHVVLGLIFLKYISDAFEEQHAKLVAEQQSGADPEDPDEYRALSIFWVPPEARWEHLKAQARQPTIGQLADDAMAGIERDNPALKSVLPKDYARPALDKTRLGQLIDMISNIKVGDEAVAIRGIDGQIAHGDTFHADRHPDLKADFILANPPFNVSDWGGERLRDDKRWQYGVPPASNANFAWVQHIVHHLAPAGVAGFVLSNGSMSSNQSGAGEIPGAIEPPPCRLHSGTGGSPLFGTPGV
jgi:type I restriction-modification system DNA methylase subunit